MILHELIDRLVKYERRIHSVYQTLSHRTEYPVTLRAFWHEMAEHEHSHRAFLERTAGLLNFMDAPPAVPDAVFADVEATIAAAEAAVQQPTLSIDAAFRQALLLEASELHGLQDAWCQGFRPSLESLLHIQIPEEESHLRSLLDALHKFSSNQELRHQASALLSTYRHKKLGTLTSGA